jgi:hypothetical protein
MQLSRALAEAANSFDLVGSDGRIGPLLKVCFMYVSLVYQVQLSHYLVLLFVLQNMNKQFLGNDFAQKSVAMDNLSPEKVCIFLNNVLWSFSFFTALFMFSFFRWSKRPI